MAIRVGIDLGTTFSAVARINDETGKAEVIKNSFFSSITPSVLCFERNGNILFGEDAKNMQEAGDDNTIAFFKRNMGDDDFEVEFYGKTYNASDLSAIFLEKLVNEAEKNCGEKINSAVITVPAYFTHKEREATIRAGEKAGLKVLSIINEPTSAAFAYGLNEKSEEQTVLIYDLGGGTFDVTIARIDRNNIKILGSDGNHELGGKDWDDCIARYIVEQFEENYGLDLGEDDAMLASLLVKSENLKKKLTVQDIASTSIAYKGERGMVEISEEVFENISSHLLNETKDLSNALIESLGLTWNDITGVILVGGSTRMRMVHKYVEEMSGKDALSGVNVDEAVALGAAIRANIDDKGGAIKDGFIARLKGSKNKEMRIAGAKAVSDVTAHALGMIAISEDGEHYVNSTIINKNTTIPCTSKKTYNFRTRKKDNFLEVYVLQGTHKRPLDNIILHKYIINGIKATSNRQTRIEVSYTYTANGVVEVSATQDGSDKALPIKVDKVPDDMSWTDASPKDNINCEREELDVMLAIDLSGSMSGKPIEKAKEAMKEFIEQMDEEVVSIGLLEFADSCKVVSKLTNDYRGLKGKMDEIEIGDVGICNGAEPFTDLKEILEQRNKGDRKKYIILLTDGVWSDPEYAIKRAKSCHSAGIEVIALGFGGADEDFLKKVASMDDFASLVDLSELTASFSNIAQNIGDGASGLKML